MAAFLFFAFAAAVAGGMMMRRLTRERDLRAGAARTLGLPESPPAGTFIGEYVDLAVPVDPRRPAQLDLFDWGVRLRGLESRPDPVWEIRYGELAYARRVMSRFLPVTGVLLKPAPGVSARPMIFWTGLHADLLTRRRQRGVPADQPAVMFEWRRWAPAGGLLRVARPAAMLTPGPADSREPPAAEGTDPAAARSRRKRRSG